MYYLRTESANDAIQSLGVDISKLNAQAPIQLMESQDLDNISCSLDNPEDCLACGS